MEKRCCCGCCSVRTGTHIIAVLWLISAGYNLVKCGVNLVALSGNPEEFGASYASDPAQREAYAKWFREYRTTVIPVVVAVTLLNLVQLVLSAMLLHGAGSNRASRCRPWLNYNLGLYVITVLVLIGLGIMLIISVGAGQALMYALIVTLILAIQAYFLNVVYEYIKELEEGTGGSFFNAGQVHALPNDYIYDTKQAKQMAI